MNQNKNINCYANSLGNCSPETSKEHFISASLLKELPSLTVQGFPWAKTPKKVGIQSLQSRILCKKHNSELSNLDAEIVPIFRKFRTISSSADCLLHKNIRENINGKTLELWILKALCGITSSGNASKNNGEKINFKIPELWVQILFKQSQWVPKTGLHILAKVYDKFLTGDTFRFAPITERKTHKVIGCRFDFAGYPFFIFCEDKFHNLNYLYRPKKIKLINETRMC